MADNLTIETLTNTDTRFYPMLGPFLARRHIVRDIGGPIWDDDDKTWFVALDSSGQVLGFCAARETSAGVQFQSAWVNPDARHHGVYQALFTARADAYQGRPVRARVNTNSLPTFIRHGFREASRHGQFVEVRRDA